MDNWYAVETEAKHRRREWDRAIAADALSASALAEPTTPRLVSFPHKSRKSLNLRQLVLGWMSRVTPVASCKSTKKFVSTAQPHRAS